MAQMLSIPTCEENHTKQSPTFPMSKTFLAWLRLKVFKPFSLLCRLSSEIQESAQRLAQFGDSFSFREAFPFI